MNTFGLKPFRVFDAATLHQHLLTLFTQHCTDTLLHYFVLSRQHWIDTPFHHATLDSGIVAQAINTGLYYVLTEWSSAKFEQKERQMWIWGNQFINKMELCKAFIIHGRGQGMSIKKDLLFSMLQGAVTKVRRSNMRRQMRANKCASTNALNDNNSVKHAQDKNAQL